MNVNFIALMPYIKDLFDLRESLFFSDEEPDNYQELKEKYDFISQIVVSKVLEVYGGEK
jgi:hypothetical protein